MQDLETQPAPGGQPLVSELLGEGPALDVKAKTVAVQLIANREMEACRFWLGLFHDGSLTAAELMDKGTLREIFTYAATMGLAESTPVMLSDTSHPEGSKFIYLLPEPLSSAADQKTFMNNMVETINSWSPRSVGIYLAPELVSKNSFAKFFKTCMRELIRKTNVSEYFILPGAHGINNFINAVLEIKADLDEDGIAVYLFH